MTQIKTIPSFYEIFSFLELPDIKILDVGASCIDGDPPYHKLKQSDKAIIYGFEPSPEEYKKLQQKENDKEIYLPYALGNGEIANLHICFAPGITSLLKPDFQVLYHFHGFPEWAKIMETETIKTHRLDDIKEIDTVDYIKLDVQGSELDIINNGQNVVSNSLVIHTEVNFISFYENQPLFAEIDIALRKLGFFLHTFLPINKRVFKPLIVNNNIYAGINQVMWADAVYVRSFMEFSSLSSEELIKIAIILHDCYGSFDLAMLALQNLERKEESELDFVTFYLENISPYN
ncbi:FkbM family methyltransferase [Cyanobacterium aponinum UTEX 3221]|uniref:FkbM family methyltransferase n=1 Tax=Cyanobacterium aponinum TaxID=379064 RepID=UPI000C12C367|nr:FkbM family methyltransferase [Cyanobacterium aponinum]PHV62812.1 methyltransferase FkbM [Cyanobacterium aponinum IPPAS B-1201]WRL37718.1 FkbM family methyltransferase [Cyanobacterium aponinum UTEX 3221]